MKSLSLVLMVILVLSAAPRESQETATLSVTVKDHSDAVVPLANVAVAKIVGTGVTDDRGEVSISDLEPGQYTVLVDGTGWRSESVKDVEVRKGGAAVTVTMEPKLAPVETFQAWEPSRNELYSQYLSAMHEPAFCTGKPNAQQESYRFLWLRTFHNPILVQLDVTTDGTGVVGTKVLSGHGGYEPGTLKKTAKRKISREKVDWFRRILEEDVDFWNMPAAVRDPNVVGLDGAMWVTEARHGGKCHTVERWSPETSAYRGLGLTFLIDLADLKLLYLEVY